LYAADHALVADLAAHERVNDVAHALHRLQQLFAELRVEFLDHLESFDRFVQILLVGDVAKVEHDTRTVVK